MPRKYLVYAGITGGAGWLAYLVSMQVGTSQVAAAFFSSLAAALLSQVFARVLKAPVTIFLVAGILPTLVGLMAAVGVLRTSGFLDFLSGVLAGPAAFLHIPAQVVPLLLVRLVSSSAATVLLLEFF